MKKNFTLIALFILSLAFSQVPEVEWYRTFGGSGIEYFTNAHNMNDGGYLLIGNTQSYYGDVTGNHGNPNFPTSDIWIVKLNSEGDLVWEYTIGGSWNDAVTNSAPTTDGYILSGHRHDMLGAWFGKLNLEGNLIWERTYLNNSGIINVITGTSDGGFVFSEYSYNKLNISKANYSGDIEWTNTVVDYGTEYNDVEAHILYQTSDGGYGIGVTAAFNTEYANSFLYKLNSNLEIECVLEGHYGFPIKPTSDDGHISNIGQKYNSNCELLWDADVFGHTAVELEDGGFIFFNQTGEDYHRLRKIDSNGTILWTLDNGDLPYLSYGKLLKTSDDGYLIAGKTSVIEGNYIDDFYVIKYKNELSTNEVENKDFKIYPNPVKDVLNIQNPTNNSSYLEIFDLSGKLLMTKNFKELDKVITLNIATLPKGNYIIRIGNFSSKFIKE